MSVTVAPPRAVPGLTASVAARLRADPRRIILTGAGGWIGRATLDLLDRAGLVDRVIAFGSNARLVDYGDGRTMAQQPLAALAALPAAPSLVIHLAFLTKDRAEAMDEAAYRAANAALSDQLFSALDAIGADRLFLASSGAAARADDAAASPAMRLYGAMKRDDEARAARWAEAAAGRRAAIGRLFSLSGPFINKPEAYALAGFITDALARRPVAVHATGTVMRSYVAIRELMSLVFALLNDENGPAVTRFDSGGDPIEVGALAERVAAILAGPAPTRAARTDAVDTYVGDAARWATLTERYGIDRVALDRQILETAATLRPEVA